MQKEASETKSEIHLAGLIAEAGEDAKKRRQASMKAHADKLRDIQRAKDAGYFIRLFFICTQYPTINAQIVAIRVMEGGRDVTISY